MSPDAIISAAVRNRAAREGQIRRLQPNAAAARAKQAELEAQRDALKPTRQNFETMQAHRHVPNFFPTPCDIVQRMIDLAEFDGPGRVLEPSAGKGDIANACAKAGQLVYCVELCHSLAEVCRKAGLHVRCADFLDLTLADYQFASLAGGFDRVLMNPPFERGIDGHHVRHAFEFLRPGGRLVAVVCSTTGTRLREWARERSGWVEDLPPLSFQSSERPTGVSTSLVIANRSTQTTFV